MNKSVKLIHIISKGLLSGIMLMSVWAYLFEHETSSQNFLAFGHPTHIIYPLALAKILGLIALWTKGFPTLKEWAYAGFTFNILIALLAHIVVKDILVVVPIAALVFVAISYLTYRKQLAFDKAGQ